jgi:hypothetical protein
MFNSESTPGKDGYRGALTQPFPDYFNTIIFFATVPRSVVRR